MRRQLLPAVISMIVFTIVLGIGYPLACHRHRRRSSFADKANGSRVSVNGKEVGSSLLGQTFTEAKYFHGRPTAAGAAASGSAATDPNNDSKTVPNDPQDLSQDVSSGSNLGPTNPDLLSAVKERVADYRKENGLASGRQGAGRRGDGLGLGPRPAHLGGQRPPAGSAGRARPGAFRSLRSTR